MMKLPKELEREIESGRDLRGIQLRLKSLCPRLFSKCQRILDEGNHKGITHVLYDLIYGKQKCETCGETTKFKTFRYGYYRFCSTKCRANSPEQIQLTKDRLHTDKVRRRREQTCLEKYGAQTPLVSEHGKKKAKETCLARYGVENGGASAQSKESRRLTMLERYGVEHNFQDREMHEKQILSAYKVHEFELGGKQFKVQGYEDIAISYLHEILNIPILDIKASHTDKVPSIAYTVKGKSHVYHPDMEIKLRRRKYLVEVKSTYTIGFNTNSGIYTRVRQKAQATIDAGYRLKVLVIDRNGRVVEIDDIHKLSKKEAKRIYQDKLLRFYS